MTRKNRLLAVAVVATCCLAIGGTAVARTSEAAVTPDQAGWRPDAVAALIQRVAPPVEVVNGSEHPVVASIDRRVPLRATPSGSTATLSLALPTIAGTSSAPAGDGTVVHSGQDTDVAVQSVGTGAARVSTVLKSAASSRSFDYTFDPGVVAVVEETGAVSLRRVASTGVEQIGVLQAPWARDAGGAPVATWYEARGNLVTQIVAPTTATAYPVVADPFWIPALAVMAHFTRHAATQMAARKMSQELVERVVLNGVRTAGKPGSNTSVFTQGSGANRVRVIVDNTSGNIVTVTKG